MYSKTGNILSRLVRQKRLNKFQKGHSVIYISANEAQREKQLAAISICTEKRKIKNYNFKQGILPADIEVKVVILTLVSLIEKPDSTVASLSISLQRKGIQVNVSQIRTILSFYELKKKQVP